MTEDDGEEPEVTIAATPDDGTSRVRRKRRRWTVNIEVWPCATPIHHPLDNDRARVFNVRRTQWSSKH